MKAPTGKWKLVSRADDASSAVEYEGAASFHAAFQVATDLGAIVNWDEKAQKLYTKPGPAPVPQKPAAKPADRNGVTYPSGIVAARHPENNSARYAPAHPGEASPLVRIKPDIQLSQHFRLSEFLPKDSYDGARVHPDLVRLLEKIRASCGCPIRITSGYRPPAYNREVGGVPNSNHMDGLAADIYADKLDVHQLRKKCEPLVSGGLGYYPSQGFVHVDVGPWARWSG